MNIDRRHAWIPWSIALLLAAPVGLAQGFPEEPVDNVEDDDGDETDGLNGTDNGLNYSDGEATGEHVSFLFDEATGTVCDWSFEGVQVLDEIAWAAFHPEVRVEGASFQAEDVPEDIADNGTTVPINTTTNTTTAGNTTTNTTTNTTATFPPEDDNATVNGTGNGTGLPAAPTCPSDDGTTATGTTAPVAPETFPEDNGTDVNDTDDNETEDDTVSRMKLHDTPNGFIKLELRGDEAVDIAVNRSLNVTAIDDWNVEITGVDFEATLWKDRDSSESGFVVDGQNISLDAADKANVMFRVKGAPSGSPEVDEQIAAAVAEDSVAAEISIDSDKEVTVSDFHEVDGQPVVRDNRIDIFLDIEADVDPNVTTTPAPTGFPTAPDDNGTTNETNTTNEPTTNGTAPGDNNTTAPPPENGTNDTTLPPAVTPDEPALPSVLPSAVVVLDIDIVLADGQDIVILLDEQQMAIADDLEDALRIDDGEESEAFVVHGEMNDTLAVASMPSGQQKLTVMSSDGEPLGEQGTTAEDEGPEDTAVPSVGILAASAVVAAAAFLARRPKRRS